MNRGGHPVARRRGRPWVAALVIGALVATACDQAQSPSARATSGPTGGATGGPTTGSSTGPSNGGSGPITGPGGGSGSGASQPAILLDEVVFAPLPGASAFIDLVNAGQQPVELAGLSLLFGGLGLPLRPAGPSLAPGGRLTVRFDGAARADGAIYHAPAYVALPPESGSVSLVAADGSILDRVAWGSAPGSVRLGAGGLEPDTVTPGTSIGRGPREPRAQGIAAWTAYPPGLATPGRPNPIPPVSTLLPVDGAIIRGATARLAWYPVSGAARYRVQLATEETFAKPLLDVSVTDPAADTGTQPAGRYVWRVQSVAADGSTAAFSTPSTIELAAATASVIPAVAEPAGVLARPVAWAGSPGAPVGLGTPVDLGALGDPGAPTGIVAAGQTGVSLNVSLIPQHKDTRMLHLQETEKDGPTAWDADHVTLHPYDPADNSNCVLASVVMMNRFAGANMSQDRLGYEIRNAEAPGPETDLNWGRGLDNTQIVKAMRYALNVNPVARAGGDADRLWADVVASIDAGNPVLARNLGHAFVIVGYNSDGSRRIVSINDPAHGRYEVDVDARAPMAFPAASWQYWLAPGPIHGENQEASVVADSDVDDVVDFDETERFHTDPHLKDTDLDGVKDKQDIFAGNFDSVFGYAVHPDLGGRDFDNDGLPIERDPDSDQGGCEDGKEDTNGNGDQGPAETWNFYADDDICQGLTGTITFTYAASGKQSGGTDVTLSGSMTLVVRVKPDPADPGAYLDDGSTFTMRQSLNTRVPIDTCTQDAHQWVTASGTFTGDDGSLDAHVHDDEILLSAQQSVPASGYAETCIPAPGMSLVAGPSTTSLVFATECHGMRQAAPGPGRTYLFDCTQSPFPTAPAGEYGVTTWNVHGTLTVP